MVRICLLFIALSFFITGCQESAKKSKTVETIVNADSNFPQIMVGVWEADYAEDGYKWGVKFESDGSIKKVIHYLAGSINLAEGGYEMEGPDPNTYAIFTMGPCTSEYDKESQVLKVKMILDYYEMQLPTGNVQGRMEDNFWGKISEDGKTWNVKWVSYGWLEGAAPPDINAIDANPESLVFKKIDISNKSGKRNQ
jgi:hypothetical protein